MQTETIYWFNQYQDLKLSHEHLQKQYQQLKESQTYYKDLWESKEYSSKAKNELSQKSESLLEPFYFQLTKTKQ